MQISAGTLLRRRDRKCKGPEALSYLRNNKETSMTGAWGQGRGKEERGDKIRYVVRWYG